MPAKSKSQRRFFGMALALKRGELNPDDINSKNKDDIIKLSELPEKTIIKFAGTEQENLPNKIKKSKQLNEMNKYLGID